MLYYGRIEIFEESDINKTSESKECHVCHYQYFLDEGFKFQSDIYNGCHDVLMMSMNLSDFAILNINGADYRCSISEII